MHNNVVSTGERFIDHGQGTCASTHTFAPGAKFEVDCAPVRILPYRLRDFGMQL